MGRRTVLQKQKPQKEKQYSLCSSNLLDYPSHLSIDREEFHDRWQDEEYHVYVRNIMISRCFHSHSVLYTLKNLNLLSESMVQFEFKKITHVMEKFLKAKFPLPTTHFEMQFLFHYHFYLLSELIRYNVVTLDDFNQFLNIYNQLEFNGLNHLMLLKTMVFELKSNDKDKIITLIDRNIIHCAHKFYSFILDPDIVQLWARQELETDHLVRINTILSVMREPVIGATIRSDSNSELDINNYLSLKRLLVLYEQYLKLPDTQKKIPPDLVTHHRLTIEELNRHLDTLSAQYPDRYVAGFETGLSPPDKDRITAYLNHLDSQAIRDPLSLIRSTNHLHFEDHSTPLNSEADMFYLLKACLPIPFLEDRLLKLARHLIDFVKTHPKFIDLLTIRLYQWGFLLEGDSRSHYIEEVNIALKSLTIIDYGVSLIFNINTIEENLFEFLDHRIFSQVMYNRVVYSRLNLSLADNPLEEDLARKNYGKRELLSNVPVPPLLYTELLLTVPFADAVAKYKAFLQKYRNSYQQSPRDVLDIQDLLIYYEAKIANLYQMVGPKLFDLLSEKLGGSPLKAQLFLSKWMFFKDLNVVRIRQLIERYPVTFNDTKLLGLIISSIPLIMRVIDRYKLAEDTFSHEELAQADSAEKIETLLFHTLRKVLASLLQVPLESISELKLKELGLDYVIEIISARELMDEDEYLSVFDVMLLCDLTDTENVADVLQDAYERNPNIEKQVEHNNQIKQLLTLRGIHLKKAETYKPSSSFTFVPMRPTEGLDYTAVILSHLEQLEYFFKENLSLFQNKSLFHNNKDSYIQCMKSLNECMLGLRESADWLSKPESRKKLALLKEKIKFLIQNQPAEKVRNIAEFNEHLDHDLKNLRKTRETKEKTFANRTFHVEQWDKKNIKTFFLGNLLSCCLATDAPRFNAMVQRRMDSGTFMHVVIDEKTGEPVCGAWLFYSDKNEVIANFLELRDSYAQSQELSVLLTQRLLAYIHQFTIDIGANNFILRELTYGNLEQFFNSQLYPQLDSSFTVQKVGGFLRLNSQEPIEDTKDRYFLDAVTEENIKFFKYVPPQPEPELEPEAPSFQPG